MTEQRARTATIAALHAYPIKSCRGLTMHSAVTTQTGLAGDREWMVVDENGRFLTQREVPRLALIVPTPSQAGLRVTAPGMPELVLPAKQTEPTVRVTVWSDTVDANDAGEEGAAWFSKFLGRAVRVVRFAPQARRPSSRDWTGDVVALNYFSDGYPILVISRASLADLNSRLETALPMNRFRPNIVIDGVEPYDEDRIHELGAGDLRLRIVKPCARCKITTTEQSTGEVMGEEPLRTLKSYRWSQELRGVLFGQNVIATSGIGAALKVGQDLEVVWKPSLAPRR